METSDIHNILFNHFWRDRILSSFLNGATTSNPNGIYFDVTYLAFPYIYTPNLVDILSRLNIKSTVKSLKDATPSSFLINLENSILFYKKLTDESISKLSIKTHFNEEGFIKSVDVSSYKEVDTMDPLRIHLKAAFNLGSILAKSKPLETFIKLGLK